jgi:hypothetical protein
MNGEECNRGMHKHARQVCCPEPNEECGCVSVLTGCRVSNCVASPGWGYLSVTLLHVEPYITEPDAFGWCTWDRCYLTLLGGVWVHQGQ